ncbi:hypothetical protein GCM10023333_05080 [Ferrimonas pelagia]|uniref:Disulfide bond formation protein B n=1 Tax=Ferrimonas pelagia TaxID=1177826 RepID=A0ABP9ECI7_9GAMM
MVCITFFKFECAIDVMDAFRYVDWCEGCYQPHSPDITIIGGVDMLFWISLGVIAVVVVPVAVRLGQTESEW